jgi:uroporphyrin-III C-methyltransferase/precorrin-2 dehydrogenase/sirohydrochlorin ferrochelatase
MRSFPIFVSFESKPPLVVGGGELAAIKTRLLLKRAASVDVAADDIVPELRALADAGQVTVISSRPGIDQLRGRPLVISATEDREEDTRVSAMARALGVPVNVPDVPELCSFSLPAIVDRGEVMVAIGTSAAAPVLAQRIRAWLERELHPKLDSLAKLAGEYRAPVARKVPSGPTRRRFWERIFDGRPAAAVLDGDEAEARRLIDAAIEEAATAPVPTGRVLLVGAGPGDPDLLTMRAVRALKEADVICYDRLIGPGILELARREAVMISVGKAKGEHSVPQDRINALLVERAQAGETVLRLKGGDPLVFGRGGEELDALRQAGISVEIIPGITAGLAAASSLQIPLTHREHAHSLTFMSGHGLSGEEPSFEHLDLKALASGQSTLLVYMAVTTAGQVAQRLLDAGWKGSTPVIAVENASRDDERRVAATVAELAAHPESLGLKSPAVLIFGEVAGLPAAGVVEDVLSRRELRRVYA